MPGKLFLGAAIVAKGNISIGFKMIEETQYTFTREGRKYYSALTEYVLGKIYSQIAQGNSSISLLSLAKNIGFLVKNVPLEGTKPS